MRRWFDEPLGMNAFDCSLRRQRAGRAVTAAALSLLVVVGCAAQDEPGDESAEGASHAGGMAAGGASSTGGGGGGAKAGAASGGATAPGKGGTANEGGASGGETGVGGTTGSGGKAGSGGVGGKGGNAGDGGGSSGGGAGGKAGAGGGGAGAGGGAGDGGTGGKAGGGGAGGTGGSGGEQPVELNLTRFILGTATATSARGKVVVTWDSDSLDLDFEVGDPTPQNDSDLSWEDDSVEIYLDLNNAKSATYQADDFQINVPRSAGALAGIGTNLNYGAITVERTSDAQGYQLKVSIPWAALNNASDPTGKTIGFDVAINDDNGGGTRDTQVMLYGGDHNYENTSLFGTLELTP